MKNYGLNVDLLLDIQPIIRNHKPVRRNRRLDSDSVFRHDIYDNLYITDVLMECAIAFPSYIFKGKNLSRYTILSVCR